MRYKLQMESDNALPPNCDFIEADEWGTYNDMPEPFVKATEHDFIREFAIYAPDYIVFRQLMTDPDTGEKACLQTKIFVFHDVAFAVVFPNKWRCGDSSCNEPRMVYTEPVRYYRLGCLHRFKELTQDECRKLGINHFGKCYHVYRCDHCGHVNEVDSSG